MKLTVVIVNYNVKYFLEQCLLSVEKALRGIDGEVYVVDNNSVDGSIEMLGEKFPRVLLIANKENTGFSRANNQAMRLAKGEYILLLNPDTVVEEDTLRKVIDFMDLHPDAGGLGVKMVDGKGNFLPESKRGLPSPETSFYKISGISRLFPRSSRFNRYYLGHLPNNEVQEIEILSGAFMMMRKKTLDQVGLLDEAFFMYGEDIDLSWRIILGGWKNYYFPHTSIIHYKGESTKKGSLNYVFVFYNAMVIFARKHFSERNARLYSFIINIAIWLRAGLAVISRFVKRTWLPAMDISLTLAALFFIKNIYADTQHKIYDARLVLWAFLSYVCIWCVSCWIGGGYDKPVKPARVFRPLLLGSAIILIIYSLLPEDFRFSRALILIGSFAAMVVFFLDHIIYNLILHGKTGLGRKAGSRIAVCGKPDEIERVQNILSQTSHNQAFIVKVSAGGDEEGMTGSIDQLEEIVRVHDIDQVVFCARDMSSSDIISTMSRTGSRNIDFKIAPPESLYIIGSNSIESTADVFMLDVNSVSLPRNRRAKRSLDLALALILIPFLPLMIVVVDNFGGFIKNILDVIANKKTWIGFAPMTVRGVTLPGLKPGILHPLSHLPVSSHTEENIQKMNIVYAKDYRVMKDLVLLWRARKSLGQ